MAVAGETEGDESGVECGLYHLVYRVLSVAVDGVGVQVRYGCHACILSSVGYLFQYYHGDNI